MGEFETTEDTLDFFAATAPRWRMITRHRPSGCYPVISTVELPEVAASLSGYLYESAVFDGVNRLRPVAWYATREAARAGHQNLMNQGVLEEWLRSIRYIG